MHHFYEQQQHQLGDIVAVVNAIVTQDVAEVPELLYDVVIVLWVEFMVIEYMTALECWFSACRMVLVYCCLRSSNA